MTSSLVMLNSPVSVALSAIVHVVCREGLAPAFHSISKAPHCDAISVSSIISCAVLVSVGVLLNMACWISAPRSISSCMISVCPVTAAMANGLAASSL